MGDGNNVANSVIEAAGEFKFNVRLGCPHGYDPNSDYVARARARGASIEIVRDAAAAVSGADMVVTDTWISMGQQHADDKLTAMMPFQVTAALMAKAKPDAIFLHCLPAHRGEEVTADVIEGPRSRVWDEAENRVHAQKSILLWVFGLIG